MGIEHVVMQKAINKCHYKSCFTFPISRKFQFFLQGAVDAEVHKSFLPSRLWTTSRWQAPIFTNHPALAGSGRQEKGKDKTQREEGEVRTRREGASRRARQLRQRPSKGRAQLHPRAGVAEDSTPRNRRGLGWRPEEWGLQWMVFTGCSVL